MDRYEFDYSFKEESKDKKAGWIALIAILLVIIGIMIALLYIVNLKKTDKLYEETANQYVHINNYEEYGKTNSDNSDVNYSESEAEDKEGNSGAEDDSLNGSLNEKENNKKEPKEYTFRYTGDWKEQMSIDLVSLNAKYPDIKGWLFFENDDISYPIMYSGEDEKYLRTTFDGKSAKAGSIFLEGLNSSDFSDSHTLIYGHNMNNGSMFGKLREFVNEPNYYDYHRYFQIAYISPEGSVIKNRYEIFSYFMTPYDSEVYTVIYDEGEEMEDLVNYLTANSIRSVSDDVKSSDRIVTLSTCSSNNIRFAVHARLVDSCNQ